MINHEARRRDILEKSLRLFAEQGYEDVTLQKIADRCGIARTTLYKYFKDKRQIFDYTISLTTADLTQTYAELTSASLPACEKLKNVLNHVLSLIFLHRLLLTVILDYVLSAQRTGRSMRKPIEKHTIGLKTVLRRLIREGKRHGEIAIMPVGVACNLLYSILESAILRITISENADIAEYKAMIERTVERIRTDDKL
jgi:AcrR family transcriptional regulator